MRKIVLFIAVLYSIAAHSQTVKLESGSLIRVADTKVVSAGDLFYWNGTAFVQLPTGTAKQTLRPNGSGGYGWKDSVAITSGHYTPTYTGTSNVASISGSIMHYIQAGNEITLDGTVVIQATAGSTNTTATISIPVASNFTAATDLIGSGVSPAGPVATLAANTVAKIIQFAFTSTNTTNNTYSYHCTYTVQ